MNGTISLVTGPMFSGKSTWLIEKLGQKNSEEVLPIRYFLDDRYSLDSISTHDGKKLQAKSAQTEQEILDFLKENPRVTTVGVDELQFFPPTIADMFLTLKSQGINVITSGLNVDHYNKEWETTHNVRKIADEVTHFVAICAACGNKNATITNRKGRRSERVVIGGAELYESLCEKDYLSRASL